MWVLAHFATSDGMDHDVYGPYKSKLDAEAALKSLRAELEDDEDAAVYELKGDTGSWMAFTYDGALTEAHGPYESKEIAEAAMAEFCDGDDIDYDVLQMQSP